MKAHPDNFGLVQLLNGKPVVEHNADGRFALASTKKVLILLALAERIRRGEDDPARPVPAADVDRWYWPGTDGGAHEHALADFHSRSNGQTMTVADVAWAMIRWSDNAAADALFQRAGGTAPIAEVARSFGMTHQEPVYPIFGEFVAWATEADRWQTLGPAERAAEAVRLAAATSPADARRMQLSSAAVVAGTDTGGAPSEWARLMQQLPRFESENGAAGDLVLHTLGWPLDVKPGNRSTFITFQTKGGSLPGIITEVWFVEPASHAPASAIALFFRDLPAPVYDELSKNFVHQQLMQKLALDAAFRSRAQRALAS
jgi:hypothetical protein